MVSQSPTQPSVCETCRSLSFSFLVPHCTDTHTYVFPVALTLSIHNKQKKLLKKDTYRWGLHSEESVRNRFCSPSNGSLWSTKFWGVNHNCFLVSKTRSWRVPSTETKSFWIVLVSIGKDRYDRMVWLTGSNELTKSWMSLQTSWNVSGFQTQPFYQS